MTNPAMLGSDAAVTSPVRSNFTLHLPQSSGHVLHVSFSLHLRSPHFSGVGMMVSLTTPVTVEQLQFSGGLLNSVPQLLLSVHARNKRPEEQLPHAEHVQFSAHVEAPPVVLASGEGSVWAEADCEETAIPISERTKIVNIAAACFDKQLTLYLYSPANLIKVA